MLKIEEGDLVKTLQGEIVKVISHKENFISKVLCYSKAQIDGYICYNDLSSYAQNLLYDTENFKLFMYYRWESYEDLSLVNKIEVHEYDLHINLNGGDKSDEYTNYNESIEELLIDINNGVESNISGEFDFGVCPDTLGTLKWRVEERGQEGTCHYIDIVTDMVVAYACNDNLCGDINVVRVNQSDIIFSGKNYKNYDYIFSLISKGIYSSIIIFGPYRYDWKISEELIAKLENKDISKVENKNLTLKESIALTYNTNNE